MASTARTSVESLEDKGSSPEAPTSSKGPPPAGSKTSSNSSMYSSAGKAGMNGEMSGMGPEGSSPALVGMQGLALVQRGLQMLNLAFPEDPGLVVVLADLTSRLGALVPQLVSKAANGAGGGMMGMAMQQPGMPGMPGMQPGMPMAGAGMPPAPPGAGPMPPGAQGPPIPPV